MQGPQKEALNITDLRVLCKWILWCLHVRIVDYVLDIIPSASFPSKILHIFNYRCYLVEVELKLSSVTTHSFN